MAATFETIGIFGRLRTPGVINTLKSLIPFLQQQKKKIVVDAETAGALEGMSLNTMPRDVLCGECDLLIVVGGDGSLLHAAHAVVNCNIPVLGINRGKLGFLADINPLHLSAIENILRGEYVLEKRFLLSAKVNDKNTILGEGQALNEVALLPDAAPHMSEFEIYIDDKFVCSQNSDGLIVATPTGSTAYALSGGGPILHPQLDAVALVPMFPHSLNMRPIVINANQTIKIVISKDNITTPRITCDSQGYIPAPPGSEIIIEKKAEQLQLIHPLDYDYYETLRSKLHWGHRLHLQE